MIDDDDHEDQRFEEGVHNLLDALPDRLRRIERGDIVEVGREALFHLLHQLRGGIHRLDRVRPRKLINGNERGGFPVHPADHVVHLRAQLDAGHVLQPDHGSVLVRADHDTPEFLFRLQAALRADAVGELLPGGNRLGADLTGRVHGVLGLDGAQNLRHGDPQLGELVRPHPEAHRILARAEDLYLADARHAGHGIVDVDVGIVGQKRGVVGAVRRIEREQGERTGRGFLDRDAEIFDFGRQLGFGLRVAHLCQDLIVVRPRVDVEVHAQRHLAVVRVHRVHVEHVVHPAHHLLDGGGNRLFEGDRVRSDIGGLQHDLRRRDVRKLRDRKLDHCDDAENHHDDRNHHRDDRTIDEEFGHRDEGSESAKAAAKQLHLRHIIQLALPPGPGTVSDHGHAGLEFLQPFDDYALALA